MNDEQSEYDRGLRDGELGGMWPKDGYGLSDVQRTPDAELTDYERGVKHGLKKFFSPLRSRIRLWRILHPVRKTQV